MGEIVQVGLIMLGLRWSRIETLPGFNVNGTQINNETLKLDICGTIDGRQVAWVNVTKDGTVSFLNQQGTTATCSLDDDFNVGSKCSVTDTGPSHSATAVPVSRQTSATTPITSQSGASSSERGVSSALIQASTSISLISQSVASSSAELVVSISGSSSVAGCSCIPVNT